MRCLRFQYLLYMHCQLPSFFLGIILEVHIEIHLFRHYAAYRSDVNNYWCYFEVCFQVMDLSAGVP